MSVIYKIQSEPAAPLHIDYEKELNPEQYAAATAPPGPVLVLAGAGSGKTRTLTYRVAYLVENGIMPEQIMLLTFTNKAAREMLRRVEELIPHDISRMWGGTFHSIGHRFLRRHASTVGFRSDFTILDRSDAKELLAACIPSLGVDPKDKLFPKADAILELLSFSANTRRAISMLVGKEFDHLLPYAEDLVKLRDQYASRKRRANAVDYDDLLTLTIDLLSQYSEIAQRYQEHFLYLLVDEYQDTNAVQAEMVNLLVARHHNLMVVGDDAQSIYSWRGANFENILSFPQKYPESKIFRIEINYRSTQSILSLANASIAQNTKQFPKALRALKNGDTKPVLAALTDANQQARFIVQRVLELRDEGISLREIAVLYRAHSHALELQLELTRRNIPFLITSGIPFFEQAHLKDVTAFLKIASNPYDEISFKRIVKLLPGIGDRSAEKIWNEVNGKLHWVGITVPTKSQKAWEQLTELIHQLRGLEENGVPNPSQIVPAEKMIQWIIEGLYTDYAKLKFDNYHQRLDDLRQLQEFSRQFETMSDFLSQLTLMTNLDAPGGRANEESDDILKLSTIHQAKGLEWKIVFVMMLCEGSFPLARLISDPDQVEEERRLFYVAATRAQDELYLTYPLMRYGRGIGSGDAFQTRSRFLQELPSDLMEEWTVQSTPVHVQPSLNKQTRGSAGWL